jgi:alpha-tubulin suppressor-like RCC1 family protein
MTCGVTTAGALYCWGFNGSGQLGTGPFTNRRVPTLASTGPIAMAAPGINHACALQASAVVACSGANNFGQLGDGTLAQRSAFAAVAGGQAYTQLTSGFDHSCAVTTTGEVHCWGLNSSGQLGAPVPTVPMPVNTSMRFRSP